MNPNVLYAAIIGGLLVGYVELARPGLIVPGVCGVVLVMLGIAGLAAHRINVVALLLIAAALVLVWIEATLRLNGVGAFFAAALLAFGARHIVEGSRIQWWVAVGLSTPFVAITARLLAIALRARENKLAP